MGLNGGVFLEKGQKEVFVVVVLLCSTVAILPVVFVFA